jgi:CDP-diglyceride synthetase
MPSEHALNASALEVTAVYTLHVFLALQTLYRIYKSPRRTYRLPHTLFVLLLLILGTLPTAAYLALFLNYTEAVISAPAPSLTPYDAHLGVVNPRILMLPSVAIVNMGNIPPLLVVLFTQSYMVRDHRWPVGPEVVVNSPFLLGFLGFLGLQNRSDME